MIEILQTLPFNSVQDAGRFGWRGQGIAPSGALDWLAYRVGAALLGNESEAAIEIQAAPMRLRFESAANIALTGANLGATLGDRILPPWSMAHVSAGEELTLHPPRVGGARGYLSVAGGIDAPLVLGSRSTYFREKVGGWQGRFLKAGDRLPVGPATPCGKPFGILPPGYALPMAPCSGHIPDDTVLRFLPASEWLEFTDSAQDLLLSSRWEVSPQSNRMGYRLAGPRLERADDMQLPSHPICPGVIQVPPSGAPIIQLADGNSAGGYPKIGVVIRADLWRLAQVRPRQTLRFVTCTVDEAIRAERDVFDYLRCIRATAKFHRSAS